MTRAELQKYLHPYQLEGVRTTEACYLHFCDGLSQAKAAEVTGITRAAVNKAVLSVRKRIHADFDHRRNNGIHGSDL